MRLLRLFGRRRPGPPAPAADWDGSPDASPIHAWLDAAGVPWRETRAALAERFGVSEDPAYGGARIAVADAFPPLEGLIRPLATGSSPDLSPAAPATRFESAVWLGDDARDNVRRAAAALEPTLGKAAPRREHNVFRAEWRFGPASVTLTGWPPDLQSGVYENRAHRHDPRLVTAAHLAVDTGWRLPPTPEELSWLETFVPFAEVDGADPGTIRATAAGDHLLEFVRWLPEGFEPLCGRFGRSADGTGYVLCREQLAVVPATDVIALQLERLSPGRGSGGEWLNLACRSGDGAKSLLLRAGELGGGLEGYAVSLASGLGLPLRIVDLGVDA